MKSEVATAVRTTAKPAKKIDGTAPAAPKRTEPEPGGTKKRKRIFKVSTFHH